MALGKTVKQLLTEIDSRELAEWQAFFALEPFGGYIEDIRYAETITMIANAAGNKLKSSQFALSKLVKRSAEKSPDDIKNIMLGLMDRQKNEVKKLRKVDA